MKYLWHTCRYQWKIFATKFPWQRGCHIVVTWSHHNCSQVCDVFINALKLQNNLHFFHRFPSFIALTMLWIIDTTFRHRQRNIFKRKHHCICIVQSNYHTHSVSVMFLLIYSKCYSTILFSFSISFPSLFIKQSKQVFLFLAKWLQFYASAISSVLMLLSCHFKKNNYILGNLTFLANPPEIDNERAD